ncbi:MAG TPA: AsmA family protein [Dongiaceae bacterium]
MRRVLRISAWVLGILVVIVVAAGVGIYFLLASGYVLQQAQARASKATGRTVTIESIHVDWSWTPHILLHNVNLANAKWGEAPQLFSAEDIDVAIRIWPLLGGHIVLPHLKMDAPKVALERDAKGNSNWDFNQNPVAATAVDTVKPEERSETPVIGEIEITKGKIAYRDAERKLKLDSDIDIAAGEAGGPSNVKLDAKGTLEDRPIEIAFTGGSVLQLRDTKTPYPLDLAVTFGQTSITSKGTVGDPFTFENADVEMHLKGPDLADIFPLLGIPAPSTPPYDLKGQLKHTEKEWRLEDMQGRIGNSDMSGVVAVQPREKRSYLTADLVSNKMDFDDLGPLIGIPPKTGKGEAASQQQKQEAQQLKAQENLFPDQPMHVEKLHAMDMDVKLVAKQVVAAPYLPVKAINFQVKVDNGNATMTDLKLAMASGTITGKMGLDARTDNPVATVNLRMRDLNLAAFFQGSEYVQTTNGKVGGNITLQGNGRSLAEVFGSSDGGIEVGMTGGSFSDLILVLADLNLGKALFLYVTDDHRIPVRCIAAHMSVSKGNAKFQHTVIDTKESVIAVKGNVNLHDQTLHVVLDASSKKFSVLNIPAPIDIDGKIRKPEFSLGKGVPLPLLTLGDTKDAPCDQMLQAILTKK